MDWQVIRPAYLLQKTNRGKGRDYFCNDKENVEKK